MSAPETPRRLTPTERAHELMLTMLNSITAAVTKRSPALQRESNTMTRNAKGDPQLEVVVYREDEETEDDFNARTEARYDRFDAKYPLSRKQNFDRDYLPDEKGKK
jgi:hypothetical protein